jgi:hypothetical protein
MKLVPTILFTALFLWLAQINLFLLFLIELYNHIFLWLFVHFSTQIPDSAIQEFMSNILTAMLFPISLVVPASINGTFLVVIFLLAMDSLVWGLVIGTVIHLAKSFKRKKKS